MFDPETIYFILVYTTVIWVGACMGSFSSAIAHRTINGESWVFSKSDNNAPARSACPSCSHQLAWFDLIPIVSWGLTLGRCRYCRQKISIKYPVIEICGAVLLSAVCWISGLSLMVLSVFLIGLPFILAAGLIAWGGGRPPLYMLGVLFGELLFLGYVFL
jgi:prepilin signal peptidase PulO-like enzyme (type II secretory pathway)